MLSVLPHERRKAGDPPAHLHLDEAALLSITDLWNRSKLADDLATHLVHLAAIAQRIRTQAVRELVRRGAKQAEVARHLGKSPQRVNQLVGVDASVSDSQVVA